MKPDPWVRSIGEDFREYPRELWGTRDRAQAAREDRARALLEASKPLPKAFAPLPGPPVSFSVNPISLDAPPRRDARGRALDARLQKLGIKPWPRRRS